MSPSCIPSPGAGLETVDNLVIFEPIDLDGRLVGLDEAALVDEAVRDEAVRYEAVTDEPERDELVQDEPEQDEAPREDTVRNELQGGETGREEPVREEAGRDEPKREAPVRDEPVTEDSVTDATNFVLGEFSDPRESIPDQVERLSNTLAKTEQNQSDLDKRLVHAEIAELEPGLAMESEPLLTEPEPDTRTDGPPESGREEEPLRELGTRNENPTDYREEMSNDTEPLTS